MSTTNWCTLSSTIRKQATDFPVVDMERTLGRHNSVSWTERDVLEIGNWSSFGVIVLPSVP